MAVLETLGAKQLGEILVMKYSIKDTTNWLTEHANNHIAMLATKNSTRLSTLLAMDDWYFLGRVSSFNVVLCVRESIRIWVPFLPMESSRKSSSFSDVFFGNISANAAAPSTPTGLYQRDNHRSVSFVCRLFAN